MTSPFDLQNEIVRTTHADQSSKAYHIPNLRNKTVNELLNAILKDPKCHLSKQKDVQLYEADSRWTQIRLLPLSESVEQVILRLGHSEWFLLIKSESTQLVLHSQAGPKKVYTSKMIKDQLAQYVDRDGLYCCGPSQQKDNFKSRPLSVLINQESLNRSTYQTLRPHLETMALHEKMLVSWINQHLQKKSTYISNLHRDVQDGTKLIQLIECITGKAIGDYNQKPTTVQEKLQNCDLVLRLFAKLDIPSVKGVRPKEIFAGNSGVVYGALYTLICKVGGQPKKKVRKQSQVGTEQIARNVMFSVMVNPQTLAQQLQEEGEKVQQEEEILVFPRSAQKPMFMEKSNSTGSSSSQGVAMSPRGQMNAAIAAAQEDGWEEDESEFVIPENFGAEEVMQNKQQNFGLEAQEVMNDTTIQDFGLETFKYDEPVGWQPLDEPPPSFIGTNPTSPRPMNKVLPTVRPGPSASLLNGTRTNPVNRPMAPGNRPSARNLNNQYNPLGTNPGVRGPQPIPAAGGRGKALPTPQRRNTSLNGAHQGSPGQRVSPFARSLDAAQSGDRKSFLDIEAEINHFETNRNPGQHHIMTTDDIDPSFLATQVQRDRVLKRAESVQNKFTRQEEEDEPGQDDNEIFMLATRLKNMTAKQATISKKNLGRENRASLMQLLNEEESQRKDTEENFLSQLNQKKPPTHQDYTNNSQLDRLFQIEATLDEFGINDDLHETGGQHYQQNDPDYDEFGLNDVGYNSNLLNVAREDVDLNEFGLGDDLDLNSEYGGGYNNQHYGQHPQGDYGDEYDGGEAYEPEGHQHHHPPLIHVDPYAYQDDQYRQSQYQQPQHQQGVGRVSDYGYGFDLDVSGPPEIRQSVVRTQMRQDDDFDFNYDLC